MPPSTRSIQLLPHLHCSARRPPGRRRRLRILQLTDMHLWPVEDTSWAVRAKGGRVIDFERDGYDPHGARAVRMVSFRVFYTRVKIQYISLDNYIFFFLFFSSFFLNLSRRLVVVVASFLCLCPIVAVSISLFAVVV
jgi:hypothetical protein